MTFIQFATLDDISEVYYPLIMEKPYLAAFFLPMVVFISIGLMNLVTATLVENAMKTAAMEAEEERLKLKKKIKGARGLDHDFGTIFECSFDKALQLVSLQPCPKLWFYGNLHT